MDRRSTESSFVCPVVQIGSNRGTPENTVVVIYLKFNVQLLYQIKFITSFNVHNVAKLFWYIR